MGPRLVMVGEAHGSRSRRLTQAVVDAYGYDDAECVTPNHSGAGRCSGWFGTAREGHRLTSASVGDALAVAYLAWWLIDPARRA